MAKRSKSRPTPFERTQGARWRFAAECRPFEPILPEPVYEALRKIAFDERCKIHDVVISMFTGYPETSAVRPAIKLRFGD
jgi:hypothetical protein